MTGLFAFLALLGVLAAVGFFLSARTARAELAARTGDRARLEADAEAARKAAQDAKAEAKKTRDEASALRADLERAKKKAFEQQEAARRAGGAPALREEIDKLAARLAEARAEAGHQVERARALDAELQKANAQLERARSRPVEAAPVPVPVPAAAPVPAPAADDGRLATEKDRADKAEAKLAEARKRIAELDHDLKAVRGRLETEKRVYMVQKGELGLAADRYAELRRRHDSLRKEHEELVEAVRQAAREERRLAEAGAAKGPGGGNEPAGGTAA
jgi:colicin import membrane protein